MELTSQQVCEDLLGLLSKIKLSMAGLAELYHVTPMQLYALYAVHKGNMSTGSLAAALHCDASNITGIADRLVAQKLVTRQENEHDRRAKILALTARGRQIVESIQHELPERLGCNRLDDGEQVMLHEIVGKLADASPV